MKLVVYELPGGRIFVTKPKFEQKCLEELRSIQEVDENEAFDRYEFDVKTSLLIEVSPRITFTE